MTTPLDRPGALPAEDRAALESMALSPVAGIARRAQILLLADAGRSSTGIAAELGVSRTTVHNWRRRYEEGGLGAIADRPRPGRPARVDHQAIVAATLAPPPDHVRSTAWSSRTLAAELGVAHNTVRRAWQRYGVQPLGPGTFGFDTVPPLNGAVRDVVGMWTSPWGSSMLLSITNHDHSAATGLAPIALYSALRVAVESPGRPRDQEAELEAVLRVIERRQLGENGQGLALVVERGDQLDRNDVRGWLARLSGVQRFAASGREQWLAMLEACLWLAERPATQRGTASCVPDLMELIGRILAGELDAGGSFGWTEPMPRRPARPRRTRR